MDAKTRNRLLALNKKFYETVADPFHVTRLSLSTGMIWLLDYAPAHEPLRVMDAGCGNGRLAVALDQLNRPVRYVGVDGNEQLLSYAAAQTAGLAHVDAAFVHADLATGGWDAAVAEYERAFDLVACLATLQHIPGYDLRAKLVRTLAAHLSDNGRLALTGWQFLENARLTSRQIDWAEVGINAADVEPGDALLPWKQDVYAVRYVHQVDASEMKLLAHQANLCIVDTYRADGKENNLNLYAIMQTIPILSDSSAGNSPCISRTS